ncbi:hypothetical protein D3C71_1355280 [compost metagenome]
MLIAKQGVDGFVNADIAQGDRCATVLKDFRHVVVRFQAHAAGPFHIQNRCDAGFDPFQTGDAGHQGFTRQLQTFVEQRPERGFITFRFQRDARQVKADHADIVTAFMDLLAVFIFIHAEEAPAAHRGFERTGDFHHLVVVQDVRIHAFARAFQRQLFDVVVRIAKLMVQAIANGEDQFREHRGFAVFAEARNAVAQNRLLNQTRFPAGAQAKTKGHKRRLTVGGVQGVHFIFEGLERVVALFFGAGVRIAVGIRNIPLLRHFTMLVEALGDKRGQYFVDTVNGGAAINMAGDLGDDLRRDCRGGRDRFWRFNLGVTHFKAVGQHAFQVDQHTVEHREERRVVEIVVVDLPAFVRLHHVARQQVLTGIVLGDDTGQQVALGRDHLAVFVGVFVQ